MSPELWFVAACCRWPDDDERRGRVREFAGKVASWERVVALAADHRVEGLVQQAVESAGVDVPQEVAERLRSMARTVREQALQGLGETLRICRKLEEAEIDYRVIKGSPIAMVAYGTVTIKHSVDIDILVKPADAVATVRLLRDAGYDQTRPWKPLDEAQFRSWSKVAKEACFLGDRAQVDLHWDLLDQPALMTGIDPWANPKRIALIGDSNVFTLPNGTHLAYLAAHGAMSGWSRFKWLADFAAFLNAFAPAERETLCAEARRVTGGRPVDQGLLLCRFLFGIAPADIRGSRPVQRMVRDAVAIIAAREANATFERLSRLTFATQWGLRDGLGYRMAEVARRMREQEIRFRLRWTLPRSLEWLYLPLRLPAAAFGRALLLWRGRTGAD